MLVRSAVIVTKIIQILLLLLFSFRRTYVKSNLNSLVSHLEGDSGIVIVVVIPTAV